MKREKVATWIKWPSIIWFFGILNVVAMLPQLVSVWQTRNTEGLSLLMVLLILAVQVAYSFHGFFTRDKMLMWTVGIAAGVSITTTLSVLIIRFG